MLLLDTCAVIWSARGDPIRPATAKAIQRAAAKGELFLSPISAWEIGLLAKRGKLSFEPSPAVFVAQLFQRPDVRVAAVTAEIAVHSSYLPGDFHSDPADRLLLATAIIMGLKLVTRDLRMLKYGAHGYASVMLC